MLLNGLLGVYNPKQPSILVLLSSLSASAHCYSLLIAHFALPPSWTVFSTSLPFSPSLSSAGKTQLCSTLAVTAQLGREHGGGAGKVIIMDTENAL